jgi:hypothetical protein
VVNVYRRFGQGPIRFPETSVNNYHTTPSNIPGQSRSHTIRRPAGSKFLASFGRSLDLAIEMSLSVITDKAVCFYGDRKTRSAEKPADRPEFKASKGSSLMKRAELALETLDCSPLSYLTRRIA